MLRISTSLQKKQNLLTGYIGYLHKNEEIPAFSLHFVFLQSWKTSFNTWVCRNRDCISKQLIFLYKRTKPISNFRHLRHVLHMCGSNFYWIFHCQLSEKARWWVWSKMFIYDSRHKVCITSVKNSVSTHVLSTILSEIDKLQFKLPDYWENGFKNLFCVWKTLSAEAPKTFHIRTPIWLSM